MRRLTLREATEADVPALAALYAASVRTVGPAHYSPAQVEAWAGHAAQASAFRRFVLDACTLVAEDETGAVGFAGLAADGLVTALYVRPDRMRRGVAGALLAALLDRAASRGIARLHTAASAFSRPVFERFGFRLDAVEVVERGRVRFERYRMVRAMDEAENPSRRER